MKEEWLMSGAVVPVDVDTTAALVAEIKRLIDVVGGLVLKQGPDYERGFVDGMQKQAQSSVDRAVNRMAQPEQEPVAWEDVLGAIARGWAHPENARKPMDVQLAVAIAKEIQDMYTTPPAAQRKPLTDEKINELRQQYGITSDGRGIKEFTKVRDFARAIEAAHGITGENT
jgi:hypothetical protein